MLAADGPLMTFAGRYEPPGVRYLGDAIERTGGPAKDSDRGPVVEVSDLVSGTLKWVLGILAAVIVLGIGTLVSQTIARANQLEATQRQLEIANTNHSSLQQFTQQRFSDMQRQIDDLKRQLEASEEQVRLLWPR
jgi:uncharacterized protein HemX